LHVWRPIQTYHRSDPDHDGDVLALDFSSWWL